MIIRPKTGGHQSSRDHEQRIPSSIHQIWIDPNESSQFRHDGRDAPTNVPPADILTNCLAWQTLHPTFAYTLWSIERVLRLARLHDRPDVCDAIATCRFPAMQADIARLFILEMVGGYWVDLKLNPLVSFLNLLSRYELVVTEHFPKDNLPYPNGFLINSFIGSTPYQPVVTAALNKVVDNVRRRMSGSIFYVTGAPVLMAAIEESNVCYRYW